MIDAAHYYKHATLEYVTRFRLAGSENLSFLEHFHKQIALIGNVNFAESDLFEVISHRPVAENIKMPFGHKIEPVRAAQLPLGTVIIARCHKENASGFQPGMDCSQ